MDYTDDLDALSKDAFHQVVDQLAAEFKLDLEAVPLEEFIPLPADALKRCILVNRFGSLDVYIYDLYSIAISKIARGFESDLEDVLFMLNQNLIVSDELELHIQEILPHLQKADIDPKEFHLYYAELQRRLPK